MSIFLGAVKKGDVYEFIINDIYLYIAKNEKDATKQFHSFMGYKAKIDTIKQVSKYPYVERYYKK
jgi:hypothetical protein